MKKVIFIIFFIIAKKSIGQQYKGATEFSKFVENPNVEWASYNQIDGAFNEANFNIYITNRYKNNEIKCSLPFYNVNRAFSSDQMPISYDSLEQIALYPSCILPIYDTLGNVEVVDRKSFRIKIDTPNYKTIHLQEILYVENGKLYSYIPLGHFVLPFILEKRKNTWER